MKEIGEFLKSSRIQNGVSLEEVCEDLNLTIAELENIEDGNVKAFKNVYQLRGLVKEYAKYLGIETDSIIDEFNDFMFDHTSKISLNDLMEARRLSKEKDLAVSSEKKVSSPYTNIKVRKIAWEQLNWKLIFIFIGIFIAVLTIIFLFLHSNKGKNEISKELMRKEEVVYEFAY